MGSQNVYADGMLDLSEVSKVAREAATRTFETGIVEDVTIELDEDSNSEEALLITFVLNSNKIKSITGDQLLDILTKIQSSLLDRGDGRFPIINYATKDELSQVGDS